MKKILLAAICFGIISTYGQNQPAPTMKSILLEQLRTAHNQQDWFVPAIKAVAGLTPEQAMWKDGNANHSIGQLVTHLIFWNKQSLAKFKGEKPADFDGNNNETFEVNFNKKSWDAAVKELDDVLNEWEKVVEAADDKKLQSWYSTIAHIGTHNAYHTGQILYIRKQQGSWDPEKGVK
ncbi:MAG: DinB family protein [Bacteroidetes bacterium]|nr:DinB family protein [Bacteroidota bacterium]